MKRKSIKITVALLLIGMSMNAFKIAKLHSFRLFAGKGKAPMQHRVQVKAQAAAPTAYVQHENNATVIEAPEVNMRPGAKIKTSAAAAVPAGDATRMTKLLVEGACLTTPAQGVAAMPEQTPQAAEKSEPAAKPGRYYSYVNANTEDEAVHDFSTGVSLGYNEAVFCGSGASNVSVSHLNVGLVFNYNIGKHLAIQPGLRYIMKGNTVKSSMDVDTREELDLHYLEVPAMVICKFGKVGNARIMAGCGPYVAYLADYSKTLTTQGDEDVRDYNPLDAKQTVSSVSRVDYGVMGMLGVQSPEGLFTRIDCERGLRDIAGHPDGSKSGRNFSLMFSIGFIFGGNQ